MKQSIGAVTVLVHDYDEAIRYYTETLGFELVADTPVGNGKRWVQVASPGGQTRLLLAQAAGPAQQARVGDQTGGRVFLFLVTDDFRRDYNEMRARGVEFCEAPREEAYGTVVVFKDLYGNKWDLIEHR